MLAHLHFVDHAIDRLAATSPEPVIQHDPIPEAAVVGDVKRRLLWIEWELAIEIQMHLMKRLPQCAAAPAVEPDEEQRIWNCRKHGWQRHVGTEAHRHEGKCNYANSSFVP